MLMCQQQFGGRRYLISAVAVHRGHLRGPLPALIGEPEPKTTHPLGFADTDHHAGFLRRANYAIARVLRRLTRHPPIMSAARPVLPVTLDDDDGVIDIDDAVRVAGWQGDVVLGSVT